MINSLNPFSLKNNNYLITGAASGLGKATSILLSQLEANLILVDINKEGLEQTKSQCKSSDKILPLDLSLSSTIKDAVTGTVDEFGKLHGFIHLAGIPYISPLKSLSESKYMKVLQINTIAGLELAKAFASKKVCVEGNKSIVFISSVYATVGSAANVGYAMSKAALHGITKSLAIELAPKKIRVNCIAPGFVKTEMLQKTEKLFSENHDEHLESLHPLGLGEADDVANVCAFFLSDASKWITGAILNVDGGYTAK